jgi:hypothetical protein
MKTKVIVKYIILPTFLFSSALGGCDSFKQICSSACTTGLSLINTSACNPLQASCTCQPSESKKLESDHFCTQMLASCKTLCEEENVDSNTCDSNSGLSRCQCRGPVKSQFSNHNVCLLKQSRCRAYCGEKNTPMCVDPANYSCTCLHNYNNLFSEANINSDLREGLLTVLLATLLVIGQ